MSEVKIVARVYETSDYDIFNFETVNRKVDEKQVSKLMSVLKTNGEFINPIVVGMDKVIIDGQHRFEALKRMQKPIRFIVGQHTDDVKQDIIDTNNIRRNWKLMDYLEAYSHLKPDYKEMLSIAKKYKDLSSPGTLAFYLGENGSGDTNSIKNGNLDLGLNNATFVDKLKRLDEFNKYKQNIEYNKNFTRGFMFIIDRMMISPTFSWSRMKQKFTAKALENDLSLAVSGVNATRNGRNLDKATMEVIDYYNDNLAKSKRIKYTITQDGLYIPRTYY